MTPAGRLILGFYSLAAVIILTIVNARKTVREELSGWELVLLIPTIIFLVNVI